MTLNEQVVILRRTVRQLLGHVKELQERMDALEGQSADAQANELTGSIDGLDGELRVRFLTPQEHAWAKLQRAGEATRTPEPAWGDRGA